MHGVTRSVPRLSTRRSQVAERTTNIGLSAKQTMSRSRQNTTNVDGFESVVDGLKHIYKTRIRPVEEQYKFEHFSSPLLEDGDFDAKPMVLLLGQYSVGKTSFIQYLLESDFPNMRIGPEPTTDRFVAVMHGDEPRCTPGNAAAVQADLPFRGLAKFGTGFLNKFEVAQVDAHILRSINIIDTPGVLSGEKQRLGRTYEFTDTVEWFAERADIVLLLFDAHKLDISDEFRRAIEALKGHDDKIRVVLNKADMVSNQQLMRVYGALMWSLGKVLKTPEVARVYIGSFWDKPYAMEENAKLFDAERDDLLRDLKRLPRNAAVRKANELVKRARAVKTHAFIIEHLRKQMPSMWGKEKKQRELLDTLIDHFRAVQKATGLPPSDFPNLNRFKDRCTHVELHKFSKLNMKAIDAMDDVLAQGIPGLLERLGVEQQAGLGPQEAMRTSEYAKAGAAAQSPAGVPDATPEGRALYARLLAFYQLYNPAKVPTIPAILKAYRGKEEQLFSRLVQQYGPEPGSGAGAGAGAAAGATAAPPPAKAAAGGNPFAPAAASNPFASAMASGPAWAVTSEMRREFSTTFHSAGPVGGKLSGASARPVLLQSSLPPETLGVIWQLADIDQDGALDEEEFAVAMYLIDRAKEGEPMPGELPEDVVPPSKRTAADTPFDPSESKPAQATNDVELEI